MRTKRKIVAAGVGVALSLTGLTGVAAADPASVTGPWAAPPPPTLSAASLCASEPVSSTSQQATSPCSPVNLATPVNFSDGVAARGATVIAGDARFEVLESGLVRLEYSPTGNFEDSPTVNVLDRRFDVPPYTVSEANGVLTVRTSALTLRYQLGSGPSLPPIRPSPTGQRARSRARRPTGRGSAPSGKSATPERPPWPAGPAWPPTT